MGGDLFIRGGPLMAGPGKWWPAGLLCATDGVITHAGEDDGRSAPDGALQIDAAGGLIMPGLVNAHCHGAMTLFRGLADDLPLLDWLNQHIFPAEAAQVNPEMVAECSLLAAAEMLLAGVTTVGDAYFCLKGAAQAYAQAGMRAVLAHGLIGFPAPGVPDPADGLAVCRDFVEQGRETDGPLISRGIFIHSPYTVEPDAMVAAADLAWDLACPLFIHLAETAWEVEEIKSRYGATPARHLSALGILNNLTAAVHCTWLDQGEMELLADFGVAVVHCPESNMKLASGQAPLLALLEQGIPVGLGTDGPASGNDLDLLGEAASAARLAKIQHLDPAALPASTALDLAWAGSAATLGLRGTVGRLAKGYQADVVVMHRQRPHLEPMGDPASWLIYQARGGDVRHVFVAGRQVVAERNVLTFDLAQAMEKVRHRARGLGAPAKV